MKTKWAFIICILAMSAAGASSKQLNYKDLELPASEYPKPPENITGAELKKDMEFAIYAFKKAYGGYRFLPKADTKKVEEAFLALAKVGDDEKKNVEAVCEVIGDAFWILPDAHIRSTTGTNYCGTFIKNRRQAKVGASIAMKDGKRPEVPFLFQKEKLGDREIGKLAITHFPQPESTLWNGFDDVVKQTKSLSGLIVDLRGNSGGNDKRGYQLAEALVAAQVEGLSSLASTTYERQSPEALTVLRNVFVESLVREKKRGVTDVTYLEKAIANIDKKIASAVKGTLPKEKIKKEKPRPIAKLSKDAFQGPIYILADARCGSSGEGALLALKAHPNAKFVGENTSGHMHFGNVGDVVLPHSKIILAIPTKFFQRADGKMLDKIGLSPDIPVPEGKDAMEVAMTLMETELKKPTTTSKN